MTNERKKKLAEELQDQLDGIASYAKPGDETQVALLVDNIAFMGAELTALREDIAEKGAVMMVTNGNNITTMGANPSVKVYNTMMKTLINSLDQLKRFVPEAVSAGNALIEFIRAGKPE